MTTVRLSTDGMQRVGKHDWEEFRFLIGGREYKISIFQACFLSEKVSNLVESDRTPNFLYLDVEDEGDCFQDVLSLAEGGSISICESNRRTIKSIAKALGNPELYGLAAAGEQIDSENAVDWLLDKIDLEEDSSEECSFIASHFYDFVKDIDAVSRLGVDLLDKILASDDLRLKDENSLATMILKLCERDECICLLRHVRLEYLSLEVLNQFLDFVYPCHLDWAVWQNLCKCLRIPFESETIGLPLLESGKRFGSEVKMCLFREKLFDGIISHLNKECGNLRAQKIIDVTASSTGYGDPWLVTDYGKDSKIHWFSKSEPNSDIRFDFKERRVGLTGYSLGSRDTLDGDGYLVQWVVEASNDNESWTCLDERNEQSLVGRGKEKYFCVERQVREKYRWLRIRQTGKRAFGGKYGNDDYLVLAKVEFFGALHRPI